MHKALNDITAKAGEQFKTHINKEKVSMSQVRQKSFNTLSSVCMKIMSKCNIAVAECYALGNIYVSTCTTE